MTPDSLRKEAEAFVQTHTLSDRVTAQFAVTSYLAGAAAERERAEALATALEDVANDPGGTPWDMAFDSPADATIAREALATYRKGQT